MSRMNYYLNIFEDNIIAIFLLFATGLITLNVILRYFFGWGIYWSVEMVRYLIIWLTFVGASVHVRKGTNLSIDLIEKNMNKKQLRILKIFYGIVGLLFSLALTVFGISIIKGTIHFQQMSPALQIPMFIPYLSIPLGFGLCSIRYIQDIISSIRGREDE